MNQYVHSSTCPVCFTCFHTRPRILQHVRYRSKKCHDALIRRGPILSKEQADEMDRLCKPDMRSLYKLGRRRNFAEISCLKQKEPITPLHVFPDNPNNVIHEDGLTDEDLE